MFCDVEHLPSTCVCSISLIIYFYHMCSFCYFFICLIVHAHILLYIVLHHFNKFQTLVWGHTKIPGGRGSQALKLGYERYVMVHAWQGMGNKLGMLADVQASQHNSTAHAQRFFPPKCRHRWKWHHLMMSLLCIPGVGINVSHAWDLGFQLFILSVLSFGSLGLFSS